MNSNGRPAPVREQSSRTISPNAVGSKEDDDLENSSDFFREKTLAIKEACKWRNIEELKSLAESKGGFLSDRLRRQAWSVLLGLPFSEDDLRQDSKEAANTFDAPASSEPHVGSWKELPRHRDEDQVQLDVNRAFIYYPDHQTDAELEARKNDLSNLIVEVLRRYPYLCYFQGYHDICQVLLLVLPPEQRAPAVARLSALRIRDFMLPSLAPAVSQLRLIPVILRAADPALWRHLSQTEPFFALSGTLTMYAHDITSLGAIARLFDALLAREPVFSVYMFARIVLDRRAELFDTPATEPEMLHSILSKLPRALDLDGLIAGAVALCDAHPPERLGAVWWRISAASVLKTARRTELCAAQTMDDGARFFERQVSELRWKERRDKVVETLWRYRRPARNVGLAVLVGVLALLMRRSPGTMGYIWTIVSKLGR